MLNNKKNPCIPPLLQGNKYVTDFKKNAELFNLLFAKQCSKIYNSSELPLNFLRKTDKSISAITFSCDDIATLIKNLDPYKAHGHDMISIRMLKLCAKPICKPLDLIFQSCVKQGKFPTKWKKANVVPVHKKGDKQILKNYQPVSLLPICGKSFERLIYNNLFEYLIENDLIYQTNLVLSRRFMYKSTNICYS